jgi:hypothetical protein
MKRTTIIFLLPSVLAFLFVGCGDGGKESRNRGVLDTAGAYNLPGLLPIETDPAQKQFSKEEYAVLQNAFDNASEGFQIQLLNSSVGVETYGQFLKLNLDKKLKLTNKFVRQLSIPHPMRSIYLQRSLSINVALAEQILDYK